MIPVYETLSPLLLRVTMYNLTYVASQMHVMLSFYQDCEHWVKCKYLFHPSQHVKNEFRFASEIREHAECVSKA